MTIGKNMRSIKSGAPLALLLVLALVLVPVGASAKQQDETYPAGVSVCNTASHGSRGGDLSVDSADPQDAVHYTEDLKATGNGNLNAAMHSRALSLCSVVSAGYTGGSTT